MHADERRDQTQLDRHLLSEFIGDPEGLQQRYEGLRARDIASRAKLKDAEKQAKELKQLRTQNKDLTRRLGSAHGALDAYRAESARLKSDLKRLRAGRAYRLGRALTHPMTVVRRTGQKPAPAAPLQLEAAPHKAPATAAAVTTPGATPPAAGTTPHTGSPLPERPLSEYSYEELVERFHDDRTPIRLGHVLSRAWYQRGLVTEPADLLREHPEVTSALTGNPAELAERILGTDRVAHEGISIPPRAPGAAYLPEPDRVMYCAHSTPAYNTNGYSTRTKGVASGLRLAGADVVVVGRAGYPWDSKSDVNSRAKHRHAVEVDGVDYVHLPGNPLSSTPVDRYILECADAFVREARLQRPSVIHAASNFRVGLAALIAARRLGIPFVYEVRGLWEITEASDKPGWDETERFALQSSLETLVSSEADAVLAITAQTRDELVRRGVPAERITVAPNAVTPREFLPLPRDSAYAAMKRVRTDVPVIGFAGSMVPYEGLQTLVDAATLLRDADIEFQVVVAGSGSAASTLADQVSELDLGDLVRFIGRVPSDEMPRLLSLFDIMPCPRLSLPVTEMVSPLKPLEAMSSAKSVVLSDVAPHRDIAGPHESRALLFRAGDAQDLADTLRRLIEDPDLRANLGRAGRLWCLDERTWEGLAQSIRATHRDATALHRDLAGTGRELSSLRVGLVADEFTTETLSASVRVVPLDREHWDEQLASLDLVFIESAWKGNDGTWHRGVGRYSDEEHADICGLLNRARELGIPSVFWNKEDPVHFDRFVATASLCDHVFTTDGNRVLPYLAAGVGTVRTASSLPFYAQPKIHNPLPGARGYEPTVAYAGTFYGERYAKRSAELTRLLESARPFGVAIYDRQADIPDSPYHFPPAFRSSVRGSLPYAEVIDSYKSHLANLNVNSVDGSPSMFSRRVVEVAACGGVVLSGPGRGIDETFGTAIPTSNDPLMWRALLRAWSTDPQARLAEAWLQMRAVLRSHTVNNALTIVARTAGLRVAAPERPTYAVALDSSAPDVVLGLARQSVPPAEVFLSTGGDTNNFDAVSKTFNSAVTSVRTWDGNGIPATTATWVGRLGEAVSRTHFEDLLHAQAYGPWERIDSRSEVDLKPGRPIAEPVSTTGTTTGLVSSAAGWAHGDLDSALLADGYAGVSLLVPHVTPLVDARIDNLDVQAASPTASMADRRVLVAGHDLKFATSLITELRAQGAEVLLDEWQSHTAHDEQRSLKLLDEADIILCEWGLGNAVWYSHHVTPEQRLVVRVHLQELSLPYLARILHTNVAAYVFVGELVRQAAIHSHGVPADKSLVIPNLVDTDGLDLPKTADAATNIGFVGTVPARKRLDLALDVIEGLADLGRPHSLRIKGKGPEAYPWMSSRPEEMAWYDAQYARIASLNASRPGTVSFDGHGNDMAEWYRNIGVALSVSDFESFHLTIADGAASRAMPVVLGWDGADLVYPREWIGASVTDLVARIVSEERDPEGYRSESVARFEETAVLGRLVQLLNPEGTPHVR
ncbi:glycosyltransferase [Knoellia sp. S7-12]|uniref:glycosyltransferase n=1 Tax=Knoellia sp. S7-12 TaxID=3126698 RepID=UPI003366791C